MLNAYFYILGGVIILPSVVRFAYPEFLVSGRLLAALDARGTTKRFLLSQRILGVIFGGVIILAGYLPQRLKVPVCVPLLALVFAAVLLRNKVLVGRLWAYERRR